MIWRKGVLLGTTMQGGVGTGGIAFELTPTASGYIESVLLSFSHSAFTHAGLLTDGIIVYGTAPVAGLGAQVSGVATCTKLSLIGTCVMLPSITSQATRTGARMAPLRTQA
jgi:hypothetical protein